MLIMKVVNRKIVSKYPYMELVKGKGYFYFAPLTAKQVGTIAVISTLNWHEKVKHLGLLETTSVMTNKLNDLTLEQWIEEADNINEKIEDSIGIMFIVVNSKKERRYTDKEFSTHKECWAFICNIYETSYQGMEEDLYVGKKE